MNFKNVDYFAPPPVIGHVTWRMRRDRSMCRKCTDIDTLDTFILSMSVWKCDQLESSLIQNG